jgi:hypothetical protein
VAVRRFQRWAAQRQAAFVAERAGARTAYLAWLAQRVLPGSPQFGTRPKPEPVSNPKGLIRLPLIEVHQHLDHAALAGPGERLAMTVLEEVVQGLGIPPAEAARRLARAVAACGGDAGHLAQLIGAAARAWPGAPPAAPAAAWLRTWETVGPYSL